METVPVTLNIIRNTTCMICGAAFKAPRSGKLFCSSKCKQFAYYHREEIKGLHNVRKGINNSANCLLLKEYEWYMSIYYKLSELKNLYKKENSSYQIFGPEDHTRMQKLEKEIPEYIKELRIPHMSLEEWSFVKLLHPNLKKDVFLKFIDGLERSFFDSLVYPDEKSKKNDNPIKNHYKFHLSKIAEGKIVFN